ncbi:MAG: sugar ABC transporter permease [Eubacteriales bacterium]|nr:sugar ABC transporter permease [Eubacteriales bacterium]
MQKYYKKYAAIFIAPLLICFTIAFLVPFFMGVYFSFTRYVSFNNAKWIGGQNFVLAFSPNSGLQATINLFGNDVTMPTFWAAFLRTTLFAIVSIITINFNAFILALLLTKGLKGSNLFRGIYFMPNLIGGIVLGYIWNMIINGLLQNFGTNISANSWYSFWGLVILMNWQQVGYMMIIYIAALMNVPTDLNESAEIDGANKLQTTLHITIPMVLPSFTICSFLTLTNSYKLYDQNIALSGNSAATNLLAADIVSAGGQFSYLGPEQAKALIFFIIVACISGLQTMATRKREVEA